MVSKLKTVTSAADQTTTIWEACEGCQPPASTLVNANNVGSDVATLQRRGELSEKLVLQDGVMEKVEQGCFCVYLYKHSPWAEQVYRVLGRSKQMVRYFWCHC